jgi:hypothetical protein
MSSSNVARSERMLKGMGDRVGLTEPGRQWLMAAIDPFHDTPLDVTGMPDSQTGNSVVQKVRQSITVSCPSGITTGTWGSYIYMLPWINDQGQVRTFTSSTMPLSANTIPHQNGLNGRKVDPITILSGPTGLVETSGWSDPFQSGAIGLDPTLYTQSALNLNENFTDGDYRVIGSGFEVINTSPELYQSGLTTVWRSPVPSFNTKTTYNHFIYKDTGAGATWISSISSSGLLIERPPNTLAQADIMPDTKKWKAKDGAYVVGRFNDLETSTQDHGWTQPIIGYTANETTLQLPVSYAQPQIISGAPGYPDDKLPAIYAQRYFNWSNMDISGCFLTGLAPETSYTITWIIYIERFPTQQQANLIVLANPSPCLDPIALEMYKCIVQHLPAGVPQYENGLGDWFRDAVSSVAEVVSPVLSVIPHPYAQAAAGVAKAFIKKEPAQNYSPHPAAAEPRKVKQLEKKEKKEQKEIKQLKKAVMPQKKKAGKRK